MLLRYTSTGPRRLALLPGAKLMAQRVHPTCTHCAASVDSTRAVCHAFGTHFCNDSGTIAPRCARPVRLRRANELSGPTDRYQRLPTPWVRCLRRSDGLGAVCLMTTSTYFGSPSGGGARLPADSRTRVVRSLSDGTVIFWPPGTYSGCLSRMVTLSFRASS